MSSWREYGKRCFYLIQAWKTMDDENFLNLISECTFQDMSKGYGKY
jgi:hypothetical protein